jgi:hypothetical protein
MSVSEDGSESSLMSGISLSYLIFGSRDEFILLMSGISLSYLIFGLRDEFILLYIWIEGQLI